jgi:hypothetical protein
MTQRNTLATAACVTALTLIVAQTHAAAAAAPL